MANLKDFATALIVNSPGDSGTSVDVQSGKGVRFPATPFDATAHPAGELPTLDNAEKVIVTDVTTDTLTVTRAQGDTVAQDIVAGWRISATIFTEHFDEKADQADLDAHTSNTSNPHSVTKSQVGLSNVTNDAQLKAASNLSDLPNASTARTNLGLGSLATLNTVSVGNISATGTPSSSTYLRGDGAWATPTDTTYSEISTAEIDAGTGTTLRTITGRRAKYILDKAAAAVAALTDIVRRTDTSISGASFLASSVSTATDKAITPNGVKATTDLKEDVANKSTSTSLGASDTLYPSQKAVKDYVDAALNARTLAQNPVGTIRVNRTSSANPNTLPGLSGTTWTQITDKMIMARGSTYTVDGGAATHLHGLSLGRAAIAMTGSETGIKRSGDGFTTTVKFSASGGSTVSSSFSYSTELFGTTDAGDNIPPMIVAYVWERTA